MPQSIEALADYEAAYHSIKRQLLCGWQILAISGMRLYFTPKVPCLIRPNQKNKIYAAGWLVFSAQSSIFKSFCRLINTLHKQPKKQSLGDVKHILISTIVALVLIGCATRTEVYTTRITNQQSMDMSGLISDRTMGKIYILRKGKFTGSGIAFPISDNGRPIGRIGSGGILSWERPPGLCNVGASASNEQSVSINVKAGHVYFFETRATWGAGFNSAQVEMRQLASIEGYAWVKNKKK